MAEEQKTNQDVEQALQQAIELLDDIAEWGRLYVVQSDHERLGHIRGQLDDLSNV